MLSKTDFTHSDHLHWQIDYAGYLLWDWSFDVDSHSRQVIQPWTFCRYASRRWHFHQHLFWGNVRLRRGELDVPSEWLAQRITVLSLISRKYRVCPSKSADQLFNYPLFLYKHSPHHPGVKGSISQEDEFQPRTYRSDILSLPASTARPEYQ